ncbi:MAG: hypothetical protein ACOYN3_01370 [Acidimicrobiia bacterium]
MSVVTSPHSRAASWRSDALAHHRRDRAAAQAALDDLAVRIRPTGAAHERSLSVPEPFAALLPRVQRGAVVAIDGPPGAGVLSVAFGIAAGVTQAGEWVAAVDPDGVFGGNAAIECGIDPERFVVARHVSARQWSAVVAAFLDGAPCVLAYVPARVSQSDAQRLVARARERASALLVVGPWPAAAASRIRLTESVWSEFGIDAPFLDSARTFHAHVEGRGQAPGPRALAVAS